MRSFVLIALVLAIGTLAVPLKSHKLAHHADLEKTKEATHKVAAHKEATHEVSAHKESTHKVSAHKETTHKVAAHNEVAPKVSAHKETVHHEVHKEISHKAEKPLSHVVHDVKSKVAAHQPEHSKLSKVVKPQHVAAKPKAQKLEEDDENPFEEDTPIAKAEKSAPVNEVEDNDEDFAAEVVAKELKKQAQKVAKAQSPAHKETSTHGHKQELKVTSKAHKAAHTKAFEAAEGESSDKQEEKPVADSGDVEKKVSSEEEDEGLLSKAYNMILGDDKTEEPQADAEHAEEENDDGADIFQSVKNMLGFGEESKTPEDAAEQPEADNKEEQEEDGGWF